MSAMCSECVGKLESENQSFVLCIISLTPFPTQGSIVLFVLLDSSLLCYKFSPNISGYRLLSMHVSE